MALGTAFHSKSRKTFTCHTSSINYVFRHLRKNFNFKKSCETSEFEEHALRNQVSDSANNNFVHIWAKFKML